MTKRNLLYPPFILALAAASAFATIAPVQNNATWQTGAATTCKVGLSSAPQQYH